jgi:hypothetical protein
MCVYKNKIYNIDQDGYVQLKDFSKEIFGLGADDLGSFFDEKNRFYEKYKSFRNGIRHNVTFNTVVLDNLKNSDFDLPQVEHRTCIGGIYHEDFTAFVERAKAVIKLNDQRLDAAIIERQTKIEIKSTQADMFRLFAKSVLFVSKYLGLIVIIGISVTVYFLFFR